MALILPKEFPMDGLKGRMHSIKNAEEFDKRIARQLCTHRVIGDNLGLKDSTTIVEVTANTLMDLFCSTYNIPISEARFRLSFTLGTQEISIDDNNVIHRVLRGLRKKRIRQQIEAMLRPILEMSLREYPLPNKRKYVKN